MNKIIYQIFSLCFVALFVSCSNTNGSNPSVNSHSVHYSKNDSIGAYQNNQGGIIKGEVVDRNANPLNYLRTATVDGNLIYTDKSSPEFDTKECLYLYIKKEENEHKLFLRIRYVGDQWIDLENIIFSINDIDFTIKGTSEKRETKGKKAYKIELFEKELAQVDEMGIFESLAKDEHPLALLVGKETYKKREISPEQQIAIANILKAYKYFKDKE